MPELPEVEALTRFLAEQAVDRTIDRVDIAAIAALKTFDPPIDALRGRTVVAALRRGKFLILAADRADRADGGDEADEAADDPALHLVLHLARGGWIKWHHELPVTRTKPGKGPLAARVRFDDGSGFDITEAGTEKRLAIHVARDPSDVEHVATLGIDPLDPDFTAERLGDLLAGSRSQIKGVLTDQRVIAGVGNAYSDEALHAAQLSPFKVAAKLSPDEVRRLHESLVDVLSDAVERSAGLPAKGLKKEKKEGLRVHGRTGQACPECGDVIREVSFSSKSLQYCPTCQTGGKPLADRRLSRLLK